jgi:hypothetical protein
VSTLLLVGAICVFAAAALFELDPIWQWHAAALGMVLVIAGAIRLGLEYARARRSSVPSPDEE